MACSVAFGAVGCARLGAGPLGAGGLVGLYGSGSLARRAGVICGRVMPRPPSIMAKPNLISPTDAPHPAAPRGGGLGNRAPIQPSEICTPACACACARGHVRAAPPGSRPRLRRARPRTGFLHGWGPGCGRGWRDVRDASRRSADIDSTQKQAMHTNTPHAPGHAKASRDNMQRKRRNKKNKKNMNTPRHPSSRFRSAARAGRSSVRPPNKQRCACRATHAPPPRPLPAPPATRKKINQTPAQPTKRPTVRRAWLKYNALKKTTPNRSASSRGVIL